MLPCTMASQGGARRRQRGYEVLSFSDCRHLGEQVLLEAITVSIICILLSETDRAWDNPTWQELTISGSTRSLGLCFVSN